MILSARKLSRQLLIVIIDMISFLAAGIIWGSLIPSSDAIVKSVTNDHLSLPLLAFFLIISGYICGLYTLSALQFGFRLIKASLINKILDALVFLIFFFVESEGPFVFLPYISWVLIYMGIWVLMRILVSNLFLHGLFQIPIGFLIDYPEVCEIIENLQLNPQLGFRPDFMLSRKKAENGRLKIKIFSEKLNALTYVKSNEIPLVITDGEMIEPRNERKLVVLDGTSAKASSLISFYEFVMQKLPLDLISTSWLRENIGPRNHIAFDVVKRVFDIALSIFLLVIGLPFWPFICLAIQLESPGPVLFCQDRLGKSRKVFAIYKFRTMRVNGNNHAPAERNDARVTRVGNFLRKTRLDELPQIMNILRGEMSFIGPRPERPELAEKLAEEIPFFFERNRVLPGLTGWDQICGEYHSPSYSDSYKKIQYDLYYIKNRSISLELRILLKTVRTVLFREGI